MEYLQAASATGLVVSCIWPQELPFRPERLIEDLGECPRAGLGPRRRAHSHESRPPTPRWRARRGPLARWPGR